MKYLVGTVKTEERAEVTLQELDKFGRPVGDPMIAMGFTVNGVLMSGAHHQLIFMPEDDDFSPTDQAVALADESEPFRDSEPPKKAKVSVKKED